MLPPRPRLNVLIERLKRIKAHQKRETTMQKRKAAKSGDERGQGKSTIDGQLPVATIAQAVDADRLGSMKVRELQALYAEVLGEATRCPNRTYLIKRIVAAATAAAKATPGSQELAIGMMNLATDGPGSINDEVPSEPVETRAQDRQSTSEPPAGSQACTPDLLSLEIPELQARYAEIVGRKTASTNRNYLLWKIRQAQSGKLTIGPRQRHQKARDAVMVLPLRMEAALVERIDEAWRRQGLRSRMELFRTALRAYLENAGESDVAEMILPQG